MEETTLMTVEEVAERLRVSKDTVRRWLQAGTLDGLKIGRQWRVPLRAFNMFLQFGEVWPPA